MKELDIVIEEEAAAATSVFKELQPYLGYLGVNMGNQQKIKVSGDVSLLREVMDKRHRVPPSSHKDYVPSDKVVSKPPKVQGNGGPRRRGRHSGAFAMPIIKFTNLLHIFLIC